MKTENEESQEENRSINFSSTLFDPDLLLLSSKKKKKNFPPQKQAPTPTPPPPPTPPQQDPNELPWVRREREEAARAAGEGPSGPPFAVFLVASALVAIAAVGSVFEFANKNAIFGVLPPSSPLYAPILGLFALTGLPSAGWLFYKAVKTANEEAERQDKVRSLRVVYCSFLVWVRWGCLSRLFSLSENRFFPLASFAHTPSSVCL